MSNPINNLSSKALPAAITKAYSGEGASANHTAQNTELASENERLIVENRRLTELLRDKQSLAEILEEEKKKSAELSFVSEQREEELRSLKTIEIELREQLKKLADSSAAYGLLKGQCEKQQIEFDKLVKDHVVLSEKNGTLKSSLEATNNILETHVAQNKELSKICEALEAEKKSLLDKKEMLVVVRKEQEALSRELEFVKRENAEIASKLSSVGAENENLNEQIVQLSAQMKFQSSELEKAKEREQAAVSELEKACADHHRVIEKLSADHAGYVEKLAALYASQRRESEQQFQGLMQKKGENRVSTKRALDDLAAYRDQIDRDYGVRASAGLFGLSQMPVEKKND